MTEGGRRVKKRGRKSKGEIRERRMEITLVNEKNIR